MKPVQPDDKLALVVGDKPLPRTELTKKLWVYIKKNGLQDAKKKTLINADENLKAVFNGKKQVSMFEMTKLVSGHLKKYGDDYRTSRDGGGTDTDSLASGPLVLCRRIPRGPFHHRAPRVDCTWATCPGSSRPIRVMGPAARP
jgi:hypothetical protein